MYQFEEFLRAPDKVENGSQKAPTLQWWQNLRQHFRNGSTLTRCSGVRQ
ncbi:unnamed protein product [Amoebophrya sp. A25]|nr:unnamed protein product [Amoebophrya sp. A25]|eukprot:GSA25T00027640001.1